VRTETFLSLDVLHVGKRASANGCRRRLTGGGVQRGAALSNGGLFVKGCKAGYGHHNVNLGHTVQSMILVAPIQAGLMQGKVSWEEMLIWKFTQFELQSGKFVLQAANSLFGFFLYCGVLLTAVITHRLGLALLLSSSGHRKHEENV
jgi:hypothetical protein